MTLVVNKGVNNSLIASEDHMSIIMLNSDVCVSIKGKDSWWESIPWSSLFLSLVCFINSSLPIIPWSLVYVFS